LNFAKRSFILRGEHRPKFFENRAQRKIFGPKRDEVKGNGEDCRVGAL